MSPAGLDSVTGTVLEPAPGVPVPVIVGDNGAGEVPAAVVPAGAAVPPLLQAARTTTPASSATPVRRTRDRTAIVGSLPGDVVSTTGEAPVSPLTVGTTWPTDVPDMAN